MQAVKRIEIVIDALELPRMIKLIEPLAPGYTVIQNVSGKGHRGERHADQITSVLANAMILIACAPEQVEPITKAVRPLLKAFGGLCLVSDAQSLLH